jgi:ribose 5-phosphate isomerase B
MRIAIGADHAGYEMKNTLIDYLKEKGYTVDDYGTYSSGSVDYPDYAFPTAEAVSRGDAEFGIIICGTGIGVSIAANKVKGIRAANCCTPEMAILAREHNNANVVTFGARLIETDKAKHIVDSFLETEFLEGRHLIRIEKLHLHNNPKALENGNGG